MHQLLHQLSNKNKGHPLPLYHEIGRHLFNKSKRHFWTEKQLTTQLRKYPKTALLKKCYRFFEYFPMWNIKEERLTWTHFLLLLNIKNINVRQFYYHKAKEEHWTTIELKRQIKTNYFLRCHIPKGTQEVSNNQSIIKQPFQFEFIKSQNQKTNSEWQIETALMEQLPQFLLELGNGFAFVARQKLIAADVRNKFYVDLVFYHYLQKCFVLVDLKATALDHRALGQMDMYLRLFDHYWRTDADNPTKGIILCPKIDPVFEAFTLLKSNQNLFAATYCLG